MRDLLKEKGFKATPARLAILDIFLKNKRPLSAEDIAAELKKGSKRKVNEATIYRTLSSLAKTGILRQVDLRKDSLYFEIEEAHHHHVVCTNCNIIEDFENEEVERVLNNIIKKMSKFKKINEHSLELFGLCVKCA